MKRTLTPLIAALIIAAAPLSALAQGGHGSHDHSGHGSKAGKSAHGSHASAAHESHGHAHGQAQEVGIQVEDGVRAVAHLDDVREAMSRAGMKETHHFMVYFEEEKTGKPIGAGTVALKVKGPGGMETGPIRMIGMEDGFGTDIALRESGHYEFSVGTRLADGKTRQFEFMHMLD